MEARRSRWSSASRAPADASLLARDASKGDLAHPNFRSRLVVREIKATYCSARRRLWATEKVSAKGKPLKIGLWDISRAHFYGTPKRKIYIELPEEQDAHGMVGLLKKSMYGTQDAPAKFRAIS